MGFVTGMAVGMAAGAASNYSLNHRLRKIHKLEEYCKQYPTEQACKCIIGNEDCRAEFSSVPNNNHAALGLSIVLVAAVVVIELSLILGKKDY